MMSLFDRAEDCKGLPPFDKHMQDTWSESEAWAKEVEPAHESSIESEGR